MTDRISNDSRLKLLILNRLKEMVNEKAAIIKTEIELAIETRDSETKNSTGDKYETTREMMQLEVEKNLVQLNKFEILKNELSKIDIYKNHKCVEFGSLVSTNENLYYISIGLGKIEIENEAVFCISLNSPIGKLLKKKKIGDEIHFQGKEISITNII
jgi:transcription elongation GreA/GreB family factor